MASDSLSIRDVSKRAPDLTGDTVKFDFLAPRVLKNWNFKNWDNYLCILGSLWFSGQTRKRASNTKILFSPPLHTHKRTHTYALFFLLENEDFSEFIL